MNLILRSFNRITKVNRNAFKAIGTNSFRNYSINNNFNKSLSLNRFSQNKFSSKTDIENQRYVIEDSYDPFNYNIHLTPDFKTFTFTGDVKIEIRPFRNISELQLNSKSLKYNEYSISSNDNKNIKITNLTEIEEDERITIKFDQNLEQNQIYTLSLKYTGQLNDKLKGWYRAKYSDKNKQPQHMATTQMEATSARLAIPCIDEPARKSVFNVKVTTEDHLNVFGNMPESKVEYIGNNQKTVTFMQTPLMSTYLIAFIVGEFDYVQTKTNRGTLVRTITPLGQADHGLFALDTARRALDLYEDWFKLDYPLPKLDMIGISEFEAGAMENWGLVTYREVDLLLGENAGVNQKIRVTQVVCHELAHMWFGNLVTMTWWNDLWLNESFATFIETLCTDTLYPEFKHMDSFVNNIALRALTLDSLKSSHPISVPIYKAQEVDEVFDAISYNKGCAIVRMFWEYIGNEKFMIGLRSYFNKYKYKNATKYDLFREWDIATGDKISEKMKYWIDQTGYPLVKVEMIKSDSNHVLLNVQQDLYLESGEDDTTNRKWFIPLYVLTNTHEHLYEIDKQVSKIKVPVSGDWFIKLNSHGKSFIRVKYCDELLNKLLTQASENKLSTPDMSTLLSDTVSMMRSNKVSMDYGIKVLESLKLNNNYDTKMLILGTLKGIQRYIKNDDKVNKAMNGFIYKVIENNFNKLGFKPKQDDTLDDKKLRGSIAFNIVKVYDSIPADKQPKEFKEYLEQQYNLIKDKPNGNGISNDMKSAIFFNKLYKLKDTNTFNELTDLYSKFTENYDKRTILTLVGSVDDSLKSQALNWVLTCELQDFVWGLSSISNDNDTGFNIVKDKFINDYNAFKDKAGDAGMLMESVYSATLKPAYRDSDIKQINAFLDSKSEPKFKITFSQIREGISNNNKYFNIIQKSDLVKEEYWNNK